MDRHAAKGSQLNQRDALAGHGGPLLTQGSSSPDFSRSHPPDYSKARPSLPFQIPQDGAGNTYPPMVSASPGMYPNGGVPNTMESYMSQNHGYGNPMSQQAQPHSPVTQRPPMQTMNSFGVLSPVPNQQGFQSPVNTPVASTFVPQQNVLPMNLPPSQFSANQNSVPRDTTQFSGGTSSAEYPDNGGTTQASELMILDQMAMPGTVPVFGGDGDMNKSPYVGMPEDFMAFLFNSPNATLQDQTVPKYVLAILFQYVNANKLQLHRFTNSRLCRAFPGPRKRVNGVFPGCTTASDGRQQSPRAGYS